MTQRDSDLLVPDRRQRSHAPNSWRTSHHQVWHDLRTRWRRGIFWSLCLFVFAGLAFSLALVLKLSGNASLHSATACRPDGAFSLEPYNYKYWDASGFFQITLGFGTLTFSQAKAIDVVWDVVVGRGGQALLAVISWHVFAKYVTTSMAVAPITFSTFRTVFLYKEASVMSIPRLVRDFSRRHSLHSRVAMVFMVTTLAFILAFPTLGSAMSGYSANVQSYVRDREGNYLPFNSFRYVFYIIHDGSKVNLEDDYAVTVKPRRSDEALLRAGAWLDVCLDDMREMDRKDCDLLDITAKYVRRYEDNPRPFEGEGSSAYTAFGNLRVSGPPLNISAFYIPDRYTALENRTTSVTRSDIDELKDKPEVPHGMTWSAAKQTYNQTYIEEQGRCQPQKTYQWGFSFIQLSTMITMLLLWIIGIYSMYLRSHFNMQRQSCGDVIGENRAVFQLASAMQMQLDQHPRKEGFGGVSVLTEEQLRQRVAKEINGGSMSLQPSSILNGSSDLDTNNTMDMRRDPLQFRTWLRKEKLWLIFVVLTFVAVCASVVITELYILSLLLPLELPFVVYVGQTKESKWVLLFWLFWLYALRAVVPAFVLQVMVTTPSKY